jgi:hypothetical protein
MVLTAAGSHALTLAPSRRRRSANDSQLRALQASLMHTQRVAGKMQSEHIAGLGTVDADVSVRERLAFWAELPARLARLGNRVGFEDHAKIYRALHARIPMVTPDEQRAVQEENAKDGERFWGAIRDLNASGAEEHKGLIARAERKIAEQTASAAKAAERANEAKECLERIKRGESVPGGLGKRLDFEKLISLTESHSQATDFAYPESLLC